MAPSNLERIYSDAPALGIRCINGMQVKDGRDQLAVSVFHFAGTDHRGKFLAFVFIAHGFVDHAAVYPVFRDNLPRIFVTAVHKAVRHCKIFVADNRVHTAVGFNGDHFLRIVAEHGEADLRQVRRRIESLRC